MTPTATPPTPPPIGAGGVLVTGDNPGNINTGIQVIIQNLTLGVADYASDGSGLIQSFLEYYLADSPTDAPFVGRDADLALLSAWLTDTHAPTYALLTGTAGTGKSAVLAHWTASVSATPGLHVLFYPISLRYGTNTSALILGSLIARASQIMGTPMTSGRAADTYRNALAELLRKPPPDDARLLLVIDGLDEATDVDVLKGLFPSRPPGHLRVLISARLRPGDEDGNGWRTQLVWTAPQTRLFPLQILTRDAFKNLPLPPDDTPGLPGRRQLTARLWELTQGDPLLIRWVLEQLRDLATAGDSAQIKNLLNAQPGLAAFVEFYAGQLNMLDEAGSPERDALICALTVAHGPLTKRDLIRIAPAAFTNELVIDRAAMQLKRFVIGHGLKQGFAFSHLRLRDFFATEKLSGDTLQTWRDRVLSYGRDALARIAAGELKPGDVSPYLLKYLGAHCDEAQSPPADVAGFLSQGWLQARLTQDGTYDGFLADVEVARTAGWTAQDWPMQIRGALCAASIGSITREADARILVACVREGILTIDFALDVARRKLDRLQAANDLVDLADTLPQPRRSVVLSEALGVAMGLNDAWMRYSVVKHVRGHMTDATPDLLAELETASAGFAEPALRAATLADLAGHASGAERERLCGLALEALAPPIPAEWEMPVMAAIAKLTPQPNDGSLADRALDVLIEEHTYGRETSENASDQVLALCGLASPAGLARLSAWVATLRDAHMRLWAEAALALASGSQAAAVFATTHAMELHTVRNHAARFSALGQLLPLLPADEQANLVARATRDCLTFQSGDTSATALLQLVDIAPEEMRDRLLHQAGECTPRVDLVGRIAARCRGEMRQGLVNAAVARAKAQPFANNRDYDILTLATHVRVPEAHDAALRLWRECQSIQDDSRRLQALIGLARASSGLRSHVVAAVVATEPTTRFEDTVELLSQAIELADDEGKRAIATRLIALGATLDFDANPFARVWPDVVLSAATGFAPPERAALLTQCIHVVSNQIARPEADEWCGRLAGVISTDHAASVDALVELLGRLPRRATESRALTALAARIAQPRRDALLASARTVIDDEEHSVEVVMALCEMSALLPEHERAAVLDHAAQVAQHAPFGISNVLAPLEVAKAVGGYVARELISGARARAYAFSTPDVRAMALAAVARMVDEPLREELLSDAMVAAEQRIDEDADVSDALVAIADAAPALRWELGSRAMTRARQLQTQGLESWTLTRIIAKLTFDDQEQVNDVRETIFQLDTTEGLAALTAFIEHLPIAFAQDIWDAVNGAANIPADDSHLALAALLPRWNEVLEVVGQSTADAVDRLVSTYAKPGRPYLLRALGVLAPILHDLVGDAGLSAIAQSIDDVSTWWP